MTNTRLTSLLAGTALAAWTLPATAQQTVTQPAASAAQAAPAVPAAAADPQPVVAQARQDDNGLSDIVVTAQRRSENLQNVPIAVTAVTADTLAVSGVQSTQQLAIVTPGLNIVTSGGGYVLPRIRGVGTSAAGPGIENPVATYIDGVYISAATAAMTSLANIDQVAVLKGPQGTLFGRNATGGLIQVTTRDPTQDLSGQLSITAGNHATFGSNGYLATGIVDGLAADLSVYYNNVADGFGINLANGQRVSTDREFAARSKWVAHLGADTVAKLIFDYSTTRAAAPAFRPVYGSVFTGGFVFTGGPFDVNSNVQPLFTARQGGVGLTLTHHFPSVDLVSITAYRRSSFHAVFDNDKGPSQITSTDLTQDDRQVSQEVQLVSTGDGPLKYTVGAFYFDGQGQYDPLYINQNPVTTRILLADVQGVQSVAGYGQLTYTVAPRLNLTAGLRYTWERRDFSGSQSLVTPAFTRLLASGSSSTTAKKLTWRLAADYQLTDGVLGYASYNRGFKSAGYNPQAFPPVPFQPEQLDAYEVGLKSEFLDRRLRLNVAGFYYDYKNIQVSAFRDGVLTIFNAAAARIYGLDLDATGRVSRDFTVNAGLSLLHDRYTSFPGAQLSTPLATGGNAIGTLDAGGKRLIQTPDWTLNLGGDYTIHLGQNAVRLNATYYHNAGWYPEAENRLHQPAYDLVNASATLLLDQQRFSIMVWARNIGNVAYAQQMNSQAVGDAIAVAAGRTIGATVGVKF